MRTVPVDEDDLMIPGASHLAESFLGTVLELERRSGLGLKFDVVDSGGRCGACRSGRRRCAC